MVVINGDRANSDMARSRSKEFMEGTKKSTSKTFFDKFTHHIRPKVDGSLDYSFFCKRSSVEEAFYASVGEEQVVP